MAYRRWVNRDIHLALDFWNAGVRIGSRHERNGVVGSIPCRPIVVRQAGRSN